MPNKIKKYLHLVFYLPSIFILTAFLLISTQTKAEGADDAKAFVDNIGKKVLAVLNSGDSDSAKQEQLKTLFSENVDIPWMGQFVLGSHWKQVSEEQRKNYLEPYKEYMLARYTTRFKDYTGAKYTITDVKNDADWQYTVNMQIKTEQQANSTLAGYRVRMDNGQFKIIDIIIEGVSLLNTQRSEFSAVLEQKGMDGLIAAIKEKINQEKQDGTPKKS